MIAYNKTLKNDAKKRRILARRYKHMKNLALIILLIFSGSSFAEQISEIKILNSDFEHINAITDKAAISNFTKEWELLEKLEIPLNYDWTHKIDISGGKSSGRWLYNQAGYISKLNKQLKPSYKINNATNFKNALGL